MPETFVFIGCLNRRTPRLDSANGEGIVTCRFDPVTAELTPVSVARDLDNPAYLVACAATLRVYAVWEMEHWREGRISSHAIDPATGQLGYINSQPTLGNMTTHVALGAGSAWISNFSVLPGGAAHAVLPLRGDGGLLPAVASVPWEQGSEAHGIAISPDGTRGLCTNRGLDQALLFRTGGGAAFADSIRIELPPGCGPRHAVFHPDGRSAYVVAEHSSTIFRIAVDDGHGGDVAETVPCLPAGWKGRNTAAAIRLDPNGTILVATMRGHDSLALYDIGIEGALTHRANVAAGGRVPRDCCFDPTGRFLFVGLQESGGVAVFDLIGDKPEFRTYLSIGTPMAIACILVA